MFLSLFTLDLDGVFDLRIFEIAHWRLFGSRSLLMINYAPMTCGPALSVDVLWLRVYTNDHWFWQDESD